ncbi:hypothetical protein [Halomarina pelagica]|nr:hypothetical protein [Halomarina sp. BND7]
MPNSAELPATSPAGRGRCRRASLAAGSTARRLDARGDPFEGGDG